MLIAFCGIDGSGKTTQISMLKHRLGLGLNIHTTKQPSEWYRKDPRVRMLLDQQQTNDLLLTELALFAAADRLRHYQIDIYPMLQAGALVLCDRYVYSSYAYFLARGLCNIDWLININMFAPHPDYTFYLDISPESAIRRITNRDRAFSKKEERDITLMSKVRQNFIDQPWGKAKNYIILDGSRDIIDVLKSILSVLSIAFPHLDKMQKSKNSL